MSNLPLDQFFTGSGLVYVTVGFLTLLGLIVRGISKDPIVRRRAMLVVGLLLIFVILRVALAELPPHSSRSILTPTGETVQGLVPNPGFQIVSITMLIVGLLAVLLIVSMILVDFLLVRRLKFEIANILRDVTIMALFFVGVMMILIYQTDLDVAGLFTTSAVLSVIIGLALQDTLGNVFSGLALQTERSFHVGDWVRFGEMEGVVTDISWRATILRTRQNDLVIIPNSLISKDVVVNYSAPTRVHAILGDIGVHYRHPPAAVIRAIVEASDQTSAILKLPVVDVRTFHYGDFAITYRVKYWIKDYADLEDIQNAFMTRIWYSFSRHGIEIPFPIRNVYMRTITEETEKAAALEAEDRIFEQLREVPLFDPLTDQETRSLASRARVEHYFTAEVVMHQGQAGDSLYIIDEGSVGVVVSHDGRSEKLAELGPSAIIGEMALMTGAERTATVTASTPTQFVVIDRDAFRKTLLQNPHIAEQISEMLATRQEQRDATLAALHEAASRGQGVEKGQILSRIWEFFGFRAGARQ
ncbi:MAG TPA: mechanosensitive ion channel family protein [Gemmatimonadota bacterium]|nr:mechanosensitive ion channel family protein [Gemmatimonadota bacterium]